MITLLSHIMTTDSPAPGGRTALRLMADKRIGEGTAAMMGGGVAHCRPETRVWETILDSCTWGKFSYRALLVASASEALLGGAPLPTLHKTTDSGSTFTEWGWDGLEEIGVYPPSRPMTWRRIATEDCTSSLPMDRRKEPQRFTSTLPRIAGKAGRSPRSSSPGLPIGGHHSLSMIPGIASGCQSKTMP
jgi:hypothetical protein